MRHLVAIVTLLVLGGCVDDIVDASYATLTDAEKEGAIARGWIPAWLPRSASRIDESHNLDTNVSILRVTFDSGEPWDVPSSCSLIRAEDAEAPAIRKGWWPRDVPYGCSTSTSVVPPRHAYYRCDKGEAYLALNRGQGEFLYWRPHAS